MKARSLVNVTDREKWVWAGLHCPKCGSDGGMWRQRIAVVDGEWRDADVWLCLYCAVTVTYLSNIEPVARYHGSLRAWKAIEAAELTAAGETPTGKPTPARRMKR